VKKILLRFSMAAALTLLIVAIGGSSYAQQADQDPAPASRPEATTPQQQNDATTPAGDTMTHEATTFSGKITKKEDGKLVLKDPVTKVSYKLDDQTQAKQYVGKSVKVSGKLDMNSNTIQVDSIEPLS
jgi:uncharacterized protein YdeI (BOF family)